MGLSAEEKLTVTRARKIQRFLSQPFTVAETFTGTPGRYVALKDTISGFTQILAGDFDSIPEVAFYMVGDIEEVQSKAAEIAASVSEKMKMIILFFISHLPTKKNLDFSPYPLRKVSEKR